MADALCGPSNPLQNFQKVASADRTLQQDRLRSRLNHGGAQGFRSHDPRTGSLDAEFAAFEAGQPLDHTLNPFAQSPGPAFQPHFSPRNNDTSSWAADFQQLRLSGPGTRQSAAPQHPFRADVPLQRSSPVAGWHSEFMRHQQSGSNGEQALGAPVQNVLSQTDSLTMGFESHEAMPYPGIYQSSGLYPQSSAHHNISKPADRFDEAAFEAAFAEAASSELEAGKAERVVKIPGLKEFDRESIQTALRKSRPSYEMTQSSNEVLSSTTETASPTRPLTLDHPQKLGSDRIPPTENTESKDPFEKQQDADDLARTAGALLDSVKDDQSEKFQQSQFLALMRRLRDREAVVEGDDIVDNSMATEEVVSIPATTNHEPSAPNEQQKHPGGPFYPERSRVDDPGTPSQYPASAAASAVMSGGLSSKRSSSPPLTPRIPPDSVAENSTTIAGA